LCRNAFDSNLDRERLALRVGMEVMFMHRKLAVEILAALGFLILTTDLGLSSEAPLKQVDTDKSLIIYGTTQLDHMDAMIQGFNKKYPAIKAQYLRQGRTAVYERIVQEQRAGLFNADIYGGIAGFQGWLIAQKGLLSQYISPERKAVAEDLKDRDGFWTALYTQSYVVGYNNKEVSAKDAPRIYDDLLLPKWNGKMAMDEEDFEWYVAVIEVMGKDKGVAFMRRLAQQKLSFGKSSTFRIQLLCAREYALDIGMHFSTVESAKKKGCPVDWVVLEPGYKRPPIVIALAKNAPHSAAAKLFIDYTLSKEGQKLIQDVALRENVRVDMEPSGDVLKLKGIRYMKTNWESIYGNLDSHYKAFRENFGLR
jgi:iron(III) transport system substrate-binding protein